MQQFVCFSDLTGTWYSNQAEGEGKWWRTAKTKSTINQTCADDRVIEAVQATRPDCWTGCPQPTNRSSACFLDCLFQTMLGNETLKIAPMNPSTVSAAFEGAFRSDQKGGCPQVKINSTRQGAAGE
jgi:hypothetical protein